MMLFPRMPWKEGEIIAQLIKLRDYVSRYDWNIYRYPTQFIRLKQENWKKLHQIWNNQDYKEIKRVEESIEHKSAFAKWKSFIRRREAVENKMNTKDDAYFPKTESELKHHFLDQLYPFQLKWATSTVMNVSFMDKRYEYDTSLRYFLHRFPDTYLVMYYPIFNIKQAPIDGEILLISPIGIEVIFLIDEEKNAKIIVDDKRTWTIEKSGSQSKILSPMLALKRSENILKAIFQAGEIDFPITKIVLSRTNDIVFHSEPYRTRFIGQKQHEQWFQEKRNLASPLKNRQLKAAETLLKHCQTTSMKRPEWEEDANGFHVDTGL